MTLSLTEALLKKYQLGQRGQQPVPTRRARANFLEFALISVNSSKLFGAHG